MNEHSEPSTRPTHHDWLKMNELVRLSGAPKSTVLHYVNEGLLPPPIKTSRNSARYDPACVERIEFIKDVQSSHRLPLKAIKGLLKARDRGHDVHPLLELQEYLFGRPDQTLLDRKSFSRATALGPAQLDRFLELGLLIPLEDGLFDELDLAVGRLLARGLELGLSPEEWTFYPRLAEEIVDQELDLRRRYTSELPKERDIAVTLEFTRSARAYRAYVIDRTFQRRIMAFKGLKDRHSDKGSE